VIETLPHNGTETSIAAALSMAPRKPIDEARILAYLRTRPAGATCDEVEAALGMTHQTCSARFNGLASPKRQRIVAAGYKRPTRSGHGAQVYVLGAAERN
jgi:hypothetical protein